MSQVFDESMFSEILGSNIPKTKKHVEDFDPNDPQAVQDILKGSLPVVLQELCTLAEAGDLSAIREYNRLTLPKEGVQAYIKFDLPDDLDSLTIDDVGKVLKSILSAVGRGELSIQQASELSGIVETITHSLEIKELGVRLKDLESLMLDRTPLVKSNRRIKLIPMYKNKEGMYAKQGF